MGSRLKIWLFNYLLIALGFICLNMNIPKVIDDYPYSRSFVGVSSPSEDQNINATINTIGNLLDSQVAHYKAINGRAIVHTVVQAFCCFWEKLPFDIIQGFMMILWLTLAGLIINRRTSKGSIMPTGVIALLLMMLLLREPSSMYHGIACSVNYLWTPTLCMVFLWMYTSAEKKSPYILYVLAFLSGWSNEAFALPLAGALVIEALVNRKTTTTRQWIALALMLTGAAIMVIAPSNFHRLSTAQEETTANSALLFHLYGLRAFRIVILWGVILVGGICLRKIKPSEYFKENILWIMTIVLSVAMSVAIGGENLRQGVAGEMAAALLLTKMLVTVKDKKAMLVCHCATLILFIGFIGITCLQIPATRQFHDIEKTIALSQDDVCIVEYNMNKPLPTQLNKYLAAELSDFQIDQFRWWYGKDSVIIRNKDTE